MKTTTAKRAPTKAEIKAEIKRLSAMKPFVQKKTFFGDDNHRAIEAQIWVLKHACDEDSISERYLPKSGDGESTDLEEEAGITVDIEIQARGVLNWKEGGGEEPPSKDWLLLAIKGGYKKPKPVKLQPVITKSMQRGIQHVGAMSAALPVKKKR